MPMRTKVLEVLHDAHATKRLSCVLLLVRRGKSALGSESSIMNVTQRPHTMTVAEGKHKKPPTFHYLPKNRGKPGISCRWVIGLSEYHSQETQKIMG